MSHYQVTATLEALERWGRINERGFALLRSDKELVNQIGKQVLQKLCPPTDVDQALLSIMDDSQFFGPADWQRYYNLRVSNYDLPIPIEELNKILEEKCPFNKGKKLRDTHYLFYLPDNWKGVPLTIMKWQEIYPESNKGVANESFCGFTCYIDIKNNNCVSLARDCTQKTVAQKGWYLMPKNLPKILEGSLSKQLKDKPKTYEVAKLVECVPMHFLILEKNDEYINQYGWATPYHGNTADIDSRKETIRAGNFGKFGIKIMDGFTIKSTPIGYGSIFLYRKLG